MAPPENNGKKLICPYCKNDNVLVFVDFSKGREGKENFAICQKKVIKGVFGPKTKGCNKRFKVTW